MENNTNNESEENNSLYQKPPEKLRNSKKDVLNDFMMLKEKNNLNKSQLITLLNNCNIIEEIIIYYLDYLKETNDKDYISELISYYVIISPAACKKHNISKKSEREIFHDLMNYLISNDKKVIKIAREEFTKCAKEVEHIFKKETEGLSEKDKEYKILKEYMRWNNVYNTKIDFEDIHNEELFYYNLSNSILSKLIEGKEIKINGMKRFYELFKLLEPNKNKYPKITEYVCLGLLNVVIKNDNSDEISDIINIIENEISGIEFLNLEGYKKFLEKNNIEYYVDGNQIKIKYASKELLIDNYKKYNLLESTLHSFIILDNPISFIKDLIKRRSFNAIINKNNYFEGLLIKTILNYVKSNLSTNSIECLFKINKNTNNKIFDEVTTDKILDYIIFIPYNSAFDSARCMKNYNKIIMDPLKNVYNELELKELKSSQLQNSLKQFVNIVKRKYHFEHEQHHLVTLLLFYLYLNEKRRIDSIAREINEKEVIFILDEEYEKKKKSQNNVFKEAGWSFEFFVYGRIQTSFKINQLLFIANEENDKLDCLEYKKKFRNNSKIPLEKLINEFPMNQPLSNLVQEINEGLKEEQEYILQTKNEKKTFDEILNKVVSKIEDDKLSYQVDFQNIVVDIEEIAYNNHIYDKINDLLHNN